jgi:hypothetical protein
LRLAISSVGFLAAISMIFFVMIGGPGWQASGIGTAFIYALLVLWGSLLLIIALELLHILYVMLRFIWRKTSTILL